MTGAAPPVANLFDLTDGEDGAAVVVHYRGDARGAQAVVESIGTGCPPESGAHRFVDRRIRCPKIR